MDHWSIGRPQGAPLGLHTSVSLVVAAGVEEPGRDTPTPGTGGTDTGSVPPAPLAEGAELVSVPPEPKYRRVGVAPLNGYADVSSN
jgi:hypothetical protein